MHLREAESWRFLRDAALTIERIELYELTLPLVEPFIISGGTMTERRSLIVILYDDQGRRGFGESPPFELPFYSEETLAGARHLLEQVLIPRLLAAGVDSAQEAEGELSRGVRGNRFARAALDTALWDLEAARREVGLVELLGERLGVRPEPRIACGVALGIPGDRSLDTLRRWVEEALSRGYRRIKIKVAPGWDSAPVAVAREALAGSGVPLTVDANGAYEWPEHESNLRALDQAGLLYIEQPLAPDELVGHARLSRDLSTPICLDETLQDSRAARQIAELEGPRVWNIKVHRVGGLSEVCRIYRVAQDVGAELWAGTMPESGIGSQAAIAVAALPGFVYPSDVEPSARWFGKGVDVIDLVMARDGFMAVPGAPIERLVDETRLRAASRLLRTAHAQVGLHQH
ncbi:MAG TPA: o-succinylbenzoate synthase [Gemmatimonadales bacterium]|nr:o-succinylbenzoate synthase [Gemmatimonadales bacterium]